MTGIRRRRWLRSALFDLGVSGLVWFLLLFGGVRRGGGIALIGLGMGAVLLARRRYPLTVMGAVSALALCQVLFYPPRYGDPQPYDIAVLIAMYSVVKYARPFWHGLLAAVPVAIGIGIEVVRMGKDGNWWMSVLFLTAVCGGVWLTAYSVRTRRLYVEGLEERAATAERERDHLAQIAVADERASIARELHDVVAHSLAVMIVQADGASYALGGEPEQARLAIKQVATTGREALEDMRRLVGVLRGTSDERDPADERRRIDLDHLSALVDRARSAGLAVELTTRGERPEVPRAVELTVYRIVQEALTNVLRHAGPAASVRLLVGYRPGAVTVEVDDDGAGRLSQASTWAGLDGQRSPAAPGQLTQPGGHGLVGMRERVAVHGGSFSAGPKLGGGWRVTAEVRYERAAASGRSGSPRQAPGAGMSAES
jgi:signal transduction histidine kinase